MKPPFFILATPRSGSTSLCRILDSMPGVTAAVEPPPVLGRESRLSNDGLLSEQQRRAIIRSKVVPRVNEGIANSKVYGEKNLSYGSFVHELHEELTPRFILISRDGRDVARSLVDWHDKMFGSVYREATDPFNLTDVAFQRVRALPIYLDESDFARPRPKPDDPLYEEWEWLDRFSMCAFCWAFMMEQFLDAVDKLPTGTCHVIDYTNPDVDAIVECAEFVGADSIPKDEVRRMLDLRINSIKDRSGQTDSFPRWQEWDDAMRKKFEAIAGKTMLRTGYWKDLEVKWNP